MVVCKFYEQGNCRYGANCRFEHLNTNRQNQNPFSALSNTRGGSDGNTYNLNRDTIVRDLTEERPSWLLSAYSPSRDLPEQLWGGQLEQSFEEMRLHFMTGAAAGNPQGALNDIQQLEAQAQQKIQAAVSNPDAAIGYIQQAGNNHPNRQDLCRNDPSRSTGEFAVGKRPVGIASPQAPNAFSQPAPTSNPFGQPSALGQRPNPFSTGTSGFGQQSGPSQSSPFGQPSALGQTSALGGGGFGQTSSLGQNSTLGGGGFGQASALGQKPNPFGQPSSLGQAAGTGFGQTPSLGQKPNPFGNTGFGQASQLGAKPNPFGSGANNAAAPANPFGQPAQSTTSAFGQPAQPAANPFAAAAPQPSTTTTSAAVTGPYAPNASRQHPPFESYATKAPNGQLQMWKGQQVAPKEIDDALAIGTQNFGQGWSKIWFPDGPPPYYKETEPEGEYTEADKAKWKNFMATGKFDLATSGGGGGMPEAPPLREFVQWDF
ncbi:hypothetical protein M406DRAFT_260947 [Cryphonectria parasitica EP155]|uniref:C3H1-type domain-containing protein n=1 Tax=Cryphonectria parasitica (strain ATCC 38755 / EP155) TaxID=660469 RepID=A0A9P4XYP5_CRYP1|nr:uncharacterized protein M406DRAFT_260947 [Cryphonectria parasitica EP155]KAF3763212.1 hypothetical protein M406DRAFT_260947 [Cryphonectria parasitica EP155]